MYTTCWNPQKAGTIVAKPHQRVETGTFIELNKLDEEFLTKFTTIVEENIDMEKMDMSFMIK